MKDFRLSLTWTRPPESRFHDLQKKSALPDFSQALLLNQNLPQFPPCWRQNTRLNSLLLKEYSLPFGGGVPGIFSWSGSGVAVLVREDSFAILSDFLPNQAGHERHQL